jgi:hypothetical protein
MKGADKSRANSVEMLTEYIEPPKTFVSRLRANIKKPKTCVEIFALLVLVAYTCATFTANRLTKTTLSISQRAYLSYGLVEDYNTGVKVHLSNFGHVPAKVSSNAPFNLVLETFPDGKVRANVLRNLPDPLIVMPMDASDTAILIDLPKFLPEDLEMITTGKEALKLYGHLKYNTGFDSTDELVIALTYDWQTKRWIHMNSGGRVEFTH